MLNIKRTTCDDRSYECLFAVVLFNGKYLVTQYNFTLYV